MNARDTHGDHDLTIRFLDRTDGAALARLAERDSAEVPSGRVLGAIEDGRLIAATSVASGRTVADPFTRTVEIRALLERRASQLRGDGDGRFKRLLGRRSRAALPGSPPGAGGRLLVLPPTSRGV